MSWSWCRLQIDHWRLCPLARIVNFSMGIESVVQVFLPPPVRRALTPFVAELAKRDDFAASKLHVLHIWLFFLFGCPLMNSETIRNDIFWFFMQNHDWLAMISCCSGLLPISPLVMISCIGPPCITRPGNAVFPGIVFPVIHGYKAVSRLANTKITVN